MDVALVPELASRFAGNHLITRMRAVSGRAWFIVATEAIIILIAVLDTAPWTAQSKTAVVFGFVSTAALALRRLFPRITWLLCLPAVYYSAALIAPLIAVFSVASYGKKHLRMEWVVLVTFGANVAAAFRGDGDTGVASLAMLQLLVYCALLWVGPAALGISYAARKELGAKLEELVISQQRERRLAAASAIAEERTRLAREMHDVVSHQVSLIALQAGALRVTTTSPETEEAARTIRRLAMDTLDELRMMVGVLRRGQDADLTPQPRLADIARMVEASELPARLHDELPPDRTWSDPVQRAAYRSVQEGLTNVRKHAPGANVDVRLHAEGDGLTVTVANDAPPLMKLRRDPQEEYPSGQHGLIGLRERAELLGGGVSVSRRPDGGYELVVLLTDQHRSAAHG